MSSDDVVYLDYNATTPIDPAVAEAMQPFLEGGFGNPSSSHRLGREARAAVDHARSQVARGIGAGPQEVIFTSGGTESNNLAIVGAVAAAGGGHVITSAVEHPAVLEVVLALELAGRISLSIIGVDGTGRVDPAEVEAALRSDTVLVSLMLANNEVGTLQPVAEVTRRCRPRGVLVHTDAAQAVGKVEVNVDELGVDLLTVAGHKLYAPKGIGALYCRDSVRIEPLLRGAAHERGLRPGTENVLAIAGLGAAVELVRREMPGARQHLEALRARLLAALCEGEPALVVHGDSEHRLPNTLSVALPGVNAEQLLERLGDQVAGSTGAACHAEQVKVSHVLAAMGVDAATALATMRLSVGRFTTPDQVDTAAARILDAARAYSAGGS